MTNRRPHWRNSRIESLKVSWDPCFVKPTIYDYFTHLNSTNIVTQGHKLSVTKNLHYKTNLTGPRTFLSPLIKTSSIWTSWTRRNLAFALRGSKKWLTKCNFSGYELWTCQRPNWWWISISIGFSGEDLHYVYFHQLLPAFGRTGSQLTSTGMTQTSPITVINATFAEGIVTSSNNLTELSMPWTHHDGLYSSYHCMEWRLINAILTNDESRFFHAKGHRTIPAMSLT